MGQARELDVEELAPVSPFNAAWFLKRLVLGTAILVISFGGLAWLTHAARDKSAMGTQDMLETIGRVASQF
ncbi:MAG: hypothetical protein K0U74_03585 [Alphaproteobacteria bacterium]|nr:hypothetical protein [Alphaproteobacteria bacterium]